MVRTLLFQGSNVSSILTGRKTGARNDKCGRVDALQVLCWGFDSLRVQEKNLKKNRKGGQIT